MSKIETITTCELKPCPLPWCGGEAELQYPEPIGDNRGTVMCMTCFLTGKEHTNWQDAIAEWNHRPIETELIEALQYIRDNVSIVLNISEKRAQLGGIDHKEIAKQDGHLTGILQKAGDALEKAGVSCP